MNFLVDRFQQVQVKGHSYRCVLPPIYEFVVVGRYCSALVRLFHCPALIQRLMLASSQCTGTAE